MYKELIQKLGRERHTCMKNFETTFEEMQQFEITEEINSDNS